MPQHGSFTAKLGVIGIGLFLMALACAGGSLWVSWQLESSAAALGEAGRLRARIWQMAQYLTLGDTTGAIALAPEFDRALALLASGDPSRPLGLPDTYTAHAALTQVTQRWQRLRPQWTALPPPEPAIASGQAASMATLIDRLINAVQRERAQWTALLNQLQITLIALIIASSFALFGLPYRVFFAPLQKLRQGLARIAEGDLTARIDTGAGGEIGALSALFNRMAQGLRLQRQRLDAKVEEKTLHLDSERARLAALHTSAHIAAKTSTLPELAQAFARQARQIAHADACLVRWHDEHQGRYLLLAADGLPQEMIDQEHCIPSGHCQCTPLQADAALRVFPIHDELTRTLGHCERAGFRTVASVPLMLRERVLGELGLLYIAEVSVSAADRALLETLASHLAGAIESLRTLALEREAAVAAERELLARELHDSIAQGLSFLKIQVGLLRNAHARGNAARMDQVLRELDTGVRESLADVRELLLNFRTRADTDPIEPALQSVARKFEHQTGLKTHLRIQGEGLPLAPDIQVQVLHVVQEALSNIRKHARAQQVWIELLQHPTWRVTVRDDGCGFDESRSDDPAHIGLNIMRERAQRIGASVDIASDAKTGTRVALTLPEPPPLA